MDDLDEREESDEGFNAYWAEVQRLKELKAKGGTE